MHSMKLNAIGVVVIGGVLDALSTELIDKGKDFNLHGIGLERLLSIAVVGSVIALAAWFRSKHVTRKHIGIYNEISKKGTAL